MPRPARFITANTLAVIGEVIAGGLFFRCGARMLRACHFRGARSGCRPGAGHARGASFSIAVTPAVYLPEQVAYIFHCRFGRFGAAAGRLVNLLSVKKAAYAQRTAARANT